MKKIVVTESALKDTSITNFINQGGKFTITTNIIIGRPKDSKLVPKFFDAYLKAMNVPKIFKGHLLVKLEIETTRHQHAPLSIGTIYLAKDEDDIDSESLDLEFGGTLYLEPAKNVLTYFGPYKKDGGTLSWQIKKD